MFEIIGVLGKGAYGDVIKVKCMQSTTVSEGGAKRVLLDEKSTKKAKSDMIMKGQGMLKPGDNRSIFKD